MIIWSKCKNKHEEIFKEKESIEVFQNFDLTKNI